MRVVIDRLHDRMNWIVSVLLFQGRIRQLLDEREINARQYAILAQLLTLPLPVPLERLRQSPWYQALYLQRRELYLQRRDKTKQRDLRMLRERGLVRLEAGRVWKVYSISTQVSDCP